VLLTSSALRTPELRVARDGKVLGEPSFVRRGATIAGQSLSGLVDPRRALALFADGATLVFQGLHRYWPPLGDLVAELELELGHPCQANAYLTPPGSQGFAVHSDTHDVFVFQTHGTKLWEVHHSRGERACDLHDDCRVDDVLLRPGLCMYLPTGTPHAARAQDDASLHVTIGINQLTWREAVRRSVEQALDGVDDGHLPAGWTDDPQVLVAGMEERLAAVAAAIGGRDPAVAARAERDRFLTSRNSRLRGGLRDVLSLPHLDADTRLRRRAGHPVVVRPAGDRVRLLLGDRFLDVPAKAAPALEIAASAAQLCPADLGLDPQSNLVLARRLVREGLFEVCE